MKRSLSRVLGSLLLTMVICFGTSIVAFATENDSNVALDAEKFSMSNVETMSDTYGDYDMGEIPARGELTLYPTLNDYVGLSRTFYFSTSNIYSNEVPAGTIRVWVYKPNGNLLTGFDIGAYEQKNFKCTLPPAGKYTVVIESDVNERILASAGWTK